MTNSKLVKSKILSFESEIYLDLAMFMKKSMISGRTMTNPEIIASMMMKRGRKMGSLPDDTVIREDW